MAGASFPGFCPEVKTLKSKEKMIVASLEKVDLVSFCRGAVDECFIPQAVKRELESLDWENVSRPTVVRYLLMHVYKSIEDEPSLYDRWCEYLKSNQCVVCETQDCFQARHISELTEILAPYAHKWEEISIALGLPENVRVDLRKKQASSVVCVNMVLREWIDANNTGARTPTLDNLIKVVQSNTVGLGVLASKLQDKLKQSDDAQPPLPKKPRLDTPILEIFMQSHDTIVPETKSTIFEVQVMSTKDTAVHYQWIKNTRVLEEGYHNYSVCISNASLSSEGTYQCIITVDNDGIPVYVRSKPVVLDVSIPSHKKTLLVRYRSEPEIPEDSWPPIVNNTYINLALIKQGNTSEYARNTIQGNMDDILVDKESIEYEETFTNFESAARLLIEGRPGSGKTTLVHKFSRDWARNIPELSLHNIKLLFVVHLRGFFSDQNIKLRNIIELYYTKDSVVDSVIQEAEENDGEGFCFILDGLDEYCPESMRKTFVFRLIKRQVLPMAVVIVASRPAASSQFRSIASKQIEVIGFMKEQIFDYIENYPFCTDIKADLHNYLENHPNVHHMCYLPIHAAMVCYLFDVMGSTLPQTETEMYKVFTNLTLLRTLKRDEDTDQIQHYQSVDDLPDRDKELFLKICELSYTKTLSSKQVIESSEVKKFFEDVNSGRESLGLITVDHIAKLYGFENLYSFLHLTFQEYLAAYHLFKSENELEQVMKMHGNKKCMQVVWKFYCGLAENVTMFEEILKYADISKDDLFGVNCAFESQQTALCEHVVQSGECAALSFRSKFLTPTDLTAIGYILRNAPVEKLVLDRCTLSSEGVNAFLAEAGKKISSVKTLCFYGKDCKMDQYQLLNTCLKEMISIEVLDLSKTNIGSRKIKALTNDITLPNLRTLKLSSLCNLDECSLKFLRFNSPHLQLLFYEHDQLDDPVIGKTVLKVFGDICTFFVCGLTEWNFQKINLNYADVKLFAEVLKHQASCISLDLSNCEIGDKGCNALINGLIDCTALGELKLCKNKIDDTGLIQLSTVLKNCSQLRILNLSDNCFGHKGMAVLADSIKHCTLLENLDLSFNSIGDNGATYLATSLTQVSMLNLAYAKIADEGIISLAESFKYGGEDGSSEGKVTSLHKLVMCCNHIGDVGAMSLADCLKSHNLTELNLSYNMIGDVGAKAIAKAVSHLKELKLRIWNHRISEEGSSWIAGLIQNVDRNFHHLKLPGILQEMDVLLCNMTTSQPNHVKEIEILANDDEIFNCAAIPGIIRHCSELQNLNITLPKLVNLTSYFVESLKYCTNLRISSLIEGSHSTFASILVHCKKLKTLNLENSGVSGSSIKAIADSLQHCRNIEILNLEGNAIGTDWAQVLARGLQHCNSLKLLNLKCNGIGIAGANVLSECLQHCNSLQILNLEWNGIGAEGANALGICLRLCSSLQMVNLERNGIGAEGVKTLAEGLQYCRTLQTLNLEWNGIGASGAIALAKSLQHNSSLKTLNLGWNGIDANGIEVLANYLLSCSNLEALNLQRNNSCANGAKAIAKVLQHCSSLKSLDLGWNHIGMDGAIALITCLQFCNNLLMLNLEGNKINVGAKAFADSLQHCKSIEKVNLGNNNIDADGVKALAMCVLHCSSIQILNLEENSISVDGAKTISEVLLGSNLLSLNLAQNAISSDGAIAFAQCLQFCSLQVLNLKGNGIGANGTKALAEGLQHCKCLQELNLEQNKINADGARALAMCLQYCDNLHTLILKRNEIGAEGIKALSVGLQYCTSLQILDLGCTYVSAEGVQALIKVLQCCNNLQTLNLEQNHIGDDGTDALAKGLQHCSSLQMFNLKKNFISAAGAKALLKGLQYCSNLQRLILEQNAIGADGVEALLQGLQHYSNLRMLNLEQNSIGADGTKALAKGLQYCRRLQTLNLGQNNIGADGTKALAESLQHFNSMKILNLKFNDIGADGTKALMKCLQHWSSLEELNLESSDVSVKSLSEGLQHCYNLRILNLGLSKINLGGAKVLAESIQQCSILHALHLRWSNINDCGAEILAEGLRHCRNLEVINLEGNDIGPTGAKALGRCLQHCSNLQVLNLQSNKIGADGAKALTDGLQHCNCLQTLNLGWNDIGAGGTETLVKGLKRCSSLKILNLERNGINNAEAKTFADGLRQCSSSF